MRASVVVGGRRESQGSARPPGYENEQHPPRRGEGDNATADGTRRTRPRLTHFSLAKLTRLTRLDLLRTIIMIIIMIIVNKLLII